MNQLSFALSVMVHAYSALSLMTNDN